MPEIETKRRRGATVLFASGKGGVGKTNVVANLAVLLAAGGKRVLAVDGDLGLANLDVLLGLTPRLTVGHFLDGSHSIEEITMEGPHGLRVIPASSGVAALTSLDAAQNARLGEALRACSASFEITLIDGPAGISSVVSRLARLSDSVVAVTCPEPTALVDAYALVKVLLREEPLRRIGLVINNVRNALEGQRVHHQLDRIASRFLGRRLAYWGHIVRDDLLAAAVREQRPVADLYPDARSSRCLESLSLRLIAEPGFTGLPAGAAPPLGARRAPAFGGLETVH